MPRTIAWDLQIDWAKSSTYVDESTRLLSASGSLRLAPPESGISSPRGTVDRLSLVLDNSDMRYSPLNTSSPIWASIAYGNAYHAPMYLRVSIDGGSNYYRVFTGNIKIPKEGPPYPDVAATIEIDCRSRDEIILSHRLSTAIATFVTMHDDNYTESQIIAQFLDDAGLAATDYTLDPGLFVIPWAWMDDESPLEDIWQLAAACGGRFYVDADGEFRYENMTHWLMSPHTTSQETLTEAGYGQMVGPTYDDTELFSAVSVVASPRDTLESTTIWTADTTVIIPANASKTIVAKLRQPAYVIDEVTFTAVGGVGIDLDANISIVMTKYAQRVELAITNSHASYAAELVTLTLTGIPVSGAPSITETTESAVSFWVGFADVRPGRVRLLQGNPYVQTVGQANALSAFLSARYQWPRLSYTLRNVPGDPERRLGDRVTVDNDNAMSAARDGFITGIQFRLSDRGFVQDLEIVDKGSESDGNGLYIYDEYFVLDSSTLFGGVADARIFY